LFTLCFSSITFNSGLLAHSKKITYKKNKVLHTISLATQVSVESWTSGFYLGLTRPRTYRNTRCK